MTSSSTVPHVSPKPQLDALSEYEGWHWVDNLMQCDASLRTIIFKDGMIYDINSIELDCSGRRPCNRFLPHMKGPAPTKVSKAILPARIAFENLATFVHKKSLSIQQFTVTFQSCGLLGQTNFLGSGCPLLRINFLPSTPSISWSRTRPQLLSLSFWDPPPQR